MTSSLILSQEEEPGTARTMYADDFMDVSLQIRVKIIGSLLRHSLLKLYVVHTSFEGEPLRIILADDGYTFDYFKGLLPNEAYVVSCKGTISALKGPGLIRSDADLVVAGANQLLAPRYAASGFRIIPRWVRLFLPVKEEPYSRIYNLGRQARKYFKWMIKKSNDAGFSCEITTDPAQLDMFYYHMYRPYAVHRYGEQAMIHKYAHVKKVFNNGALGLVKKGDTLLAGTVFCRQNNNLNLPHTGVSADGVEAIKDGAAFALDYFLAQYAHSEGYDYVNFGHSRPFLSDGTLKYKMNWHMDVLPDDDSMGVFAVATPDNTQQAAKFLAANPHFYLTEEGCVLSDEQP